jgi:hypothetical protein
LGKIDQVCNPSYQEVETRRITVQGQLRQKVVRCHLNKQAVVMLCICNHSYVRGTVRRIAV